MSGPVRTDDVGVDPEVVETAGAAVLEITASRRARVGADEVRRALPRRMRRTVGSWCFVDHFGPTTPTAGGGMTIGPHPHIGLQTVTWLLEGELVHRDSLGSEQPIRPGQLNLMTAGHGVVHAEETSGVARAMHGVQLWVAQPEATRHGPAAFEHHDDLPSVELDAGTATVLVGSLGGAASRARRDTDHVGADLALRAGRSVVPLEPSHEHALVVLDGALDVGGSTVTPGHLCYLGREREELVLAVAQPARVLLIGGVPFPEPVSMWWNFVARNHDEIDAARDAWETGADRFASTGSRLERVPAPRPPWRAPC